MSDSNDEQHELHRELASHSDRFLAKTAELGEVESMTPEELIASPRFQEFARRAKGVADDGYKIADAQRAIGEETNSTDVSINDVPREQGPTVDR